MQQEEKGNVVLYRGSRAAVTMQMDAKKEAMERDEKLRCQKKERNIRNKKVG